MQWFSRQTYKITWTHYLGIVTCVLSITVIEGACSSFYIARYMHMDQLVFPWTMVPDIVQHYSIFRPVSILHFLAIRLLYFLEANITLWVSKCARFVTRRMNQGRWMHTAKTCLSFTVPARLTDKCQTRRRKGWSQARSSQFRSDHPPPKHSLLSKKSQESRRKIFLGNLLLKVWRSRGRLMTRS